MMLVWVKIELRKCLENEQHVNVQIKYTYIYGWLLCHSFAVLLNTSRDGWFQRKWPSALRNWNICSGRLRPRNPPKWTSRRDTGMQRKSVTTLWKKRLTVLRNDTKTKRKSNAECKKKRLSQVISCSFLFDSHCCFCLCYLHFLTTRVICDAICVS